MFALCHTQVILGEMQMYIEGPDAHNGEYKEHYHLRR